MNMNDNRFVLIRKELLSTLHSAAEYQGATMHNMEKEDVQEIEAILQTDASNLDRLIGDAMVAQLIDGVNYIGYTYEVTVAGQNVCDCTVTFTKKDGKTAHDLRMEAEAEVTRLKAARNIPGTLRCAKCNFRLQKTYLYMQSGTTGPGDNKTEPCPNGCGPLWPVTWEEDLRAEWASQDNAFQNIMNQRDFAVHLIKRLELARQSLDEVLTEEEYKQVAQIVEGVGLDEILNLNLKSIAKQDLES